MKIFITGSTGFIGKNLARRLVQEGHEVICAGRSLARLGELLKKVKSAYVDLNYKETILNALREERPDIVYHAAALVESFDINKLRRVNVEGTRNVLSSCLNEGVRKVIYLSSVAVISGNENVPLTDELPYKANNPYGQSKLEGEEVALEYRRKGLKIAILRPCMVYGECEPHALGRLVRALEKRMFPILGKGDKKLQLVSVENVVDVLTLCLTKEETYEGTFIIADKEILTLKELLEFIANILGAKTPIAIPEWLARFMAKVPFIGKSIGFLLKDRTYSINRLREKLGYVPRVSTYDGLKRAVLICKAGSADPLLVGPSARCARLAATPRGSSHSSRVCRTSLK